MSIRRLKYFQNCISTKHLYIYIYIYIYIERERERESFRTSKQNYRSLHLQSVTYGNYNVADLYKLRIPQKLRPLVDLTYSNLNARRAPTRPSRLCL
jgi:hypothetical protein